MSILEKVIEQNLEYNGHISHTGDSWPFYRDNTGYQDQAYYSNFEDARTAYRQISIYSIRYIIFKILTKIGQNFVNEMIQDAASTGLDVQWDMELRPNAFSIMEAMAYEHALLFASQTYREDNVTTIPSEEEMYNLVLSQRAALSNAILRPDFRISITSSGEGTWRHYLKEFKSQFEGVEYSEGITLADDNGNYDDSRRYRITEGAYDYESSYISSGLGSKSVFQVEMQLYEYYGAILSTALDEYGYPLEMGYHYDNMRENKGIPSRFWKIINWTTF